MLFDGPIAVVSFPEALIDYANTPLTQSPLSGSPGACGNELDYRPLDLGGAVTAFGEFQNVEGTTMIMETVQCNRPWSLTRRTTHVFPVRLDVQGKSSRKERDHLQNQLDGIQGTLDQASFCANPNLIDAMQTSLDAARDAFQDKRYEDAIADLEQISRDAHNDDVFNIGADIGFNTCDLVSGSIVNSSNYRGNFISRGLSAAFTVHDRFLHADVFVLYDFPNDVGVESPL